MSYKIKAKKYWFILTDVGGWDLATDKVRDFKISSVLDEGFETTDILYKMYIHKLGDISSMSTLWIDLSKKIPATNSGHEFIQVEPLTGLYLFVASSLVCSMLILRTHYASRGF